MPLALSGFKTNSEIVRANNDLYPPGLLCIILGKDGRYARLSKKPVLVIFDTLGIWIPIIRGNILEIIKEAC